MDIDKCKAFLILAGWKAFDPKIHGTDVLKLRNDYLSFQMLPYNECKVVYLYTGKLFASRTSILIEDLIKTVLTME